MSKHALRAAYQGYRGVFLLLGLLVLAVLPSDGGAVPEKAHTGQMDDTLLMFVGETLDVLTIATRRECLAGAGGSASHNPGAVRRTWRYDNQPGACTRARFLYGGKRERYTGLSAGNTGICSVFV